MERRFAMQWINHHRFDWGGILLVLLIISLMGTWGYDLINVPAQYDCSLPNVRLEGDFCGMPCPGVMGIFAVFIVLINALDGTLSLVDLRAMLPFLMIPLPFISAVLRIDDRGDHPRQWIFHLAAWGLAVIFIWFFYIRIILTVDLHFHPARLWGLWLYTALVTIVFFIEIVHRINRKRYNPDRSSVGKTTKDSADTESSPSQQQE
jgi:hypothetical protein